MPDAPLNDRPPPARDEIDGYSSAHRRLWMAQRIGWILLGLVILGALFGMFGDGPLSDMTAVAPDGSLTVEYERFVRAQSPVVLRMSFASETVARGRSAVAFDAAYHRHLTVESIVPWPAGVEFERDRIVYRWNLSGSTEPVLVTLHLKMDRLGPVAGRLRLVGGADGVIRQFVYP